MPDGRCASDGDLGDTAFVLDRSPEVDVSTFAALDLRTARILEVEPFPEARRPAWKLTLDLGPLGSARSSAQLTRYEPEELTGRLVVAAINIGTRRIAGFVSECLVLASVDDDGQPHLLGVDPGARPGDRVR